MAHGACFQQAECSHHPSVDAYSRKDVLQNNMAVCTVVSALDMVDGYYQLLMRESDIPLTAVSTPSGMLWEWLVMLQGLSNAPATFNRLVTQLTYIDDIFVHGCAEDEMTDARCTLHTSGRFCSGAAVALASEEDTDSESL
jgi:hypothetical protein